MGCGTGNSSRSVAYIDSVHEVKEEPNKDSKPKGTEDRLMVEENKNTLESIKSLDGNYYE